jgi:flagellin
MGNKRRGVIVIFALSLVFTVPFGWPESSLDFLNNILKSSEKNINENIERLSGGIRLITDDPANYAIYEKLEANIRAFTVEAANTEDLIYYYKYAESLLGNVTDVLQRIRELILMKSNAVTAGDGGGILDSEISGDYEHILFLLKNSQFNGKAVYESLFKDETSSALFTADRYFQLENVDRILSAIVAQRSYYGAKANQLESRQKNLMIEKENASGFQSTIMDVDYGSEIALLKKNQLLFLINILLLSTN